MNRIKFYNGDNDTKILLLKDTIQYMKFFVFEITQILKHKPIDMIFDYD